MTKATREAHLAEIMTAEQATDAAGLVIVPEDVLAEMTWEQLHDAWVQVLTLRDAAAERLIVIERLLRRTR